MPLQVDRALVLPYNRYIDNKGAAMDEDYAAWEEDYFTWERGENFADGYTGEDE